MAIHGGMSAGQHQTPTMSPEHIMGKAVLKMSLLEVQQFVQTQVTENPALTLDEVSLCPDCGNVMDGGPCPACGATDPRSQKEAFDDEDWMERICEPPGRADDEQYDRFAGIASPRSLADHLKEQAGFCLQDSELSTAEFIIDLLDEDGYLRVPLVDIAGDVGMSVPQLEAVLRAVQSLDPPGIAARDLRECLLLQLGRVVDDGSEQRLAEAVVRDHWDALSRFKIDKIARLLETDVEAVQNALQYLRENTTPHPAGMFRDPWEGMYPRSASRIRPDVIVSQTEGSLSAVIPDPSAGRVAVEEMYAALHADLSRSLRESEKAHVREYVMKARALIEALEFRKSSLRKIIDELLVCQSGFFTDGPRALKPLTKKELAARIGLHESTVCRATQDKYISLPNGECIEFDTLFDSALPVKGLVRELAVQMLNDGEIAAKLAESGVHIARRTVAKYRDQLGVLPLEYRLPLAA